MDKPRKNYDAVINNFKTIDQCEKYIKNAIRLGYEDVILKTKQKRVEIKTNSYPEIQNLNYIEILILKAIHAYEEALELKHNKKQGATYTWRSVKNNGFIGMIEKAVLQKGEPSGFKALSTLGMLDLAFENIILKHQKFFSQKVIEAARNRLNTYTIH